MKKRVKTGKMLAVLTVLGLMLTGCGSKAEYATDSAAADSAQTTAGTYDNGYATDDIYSYSMTEAAEEYVYEDEAAEEYSEEESGAGGQTPEVQDTSRKLIRNVDLQVETEEFDELLSNVSQKTESLSGYIEESYTYNGSSYYGQGTRSATLTIRIPAQRLDEFLSEIAEVSNVISKNESVTDVTLQYVDMESHKKALLAEQERLLELLDQAENIEDIISIESRLSDVRYQIESMESQLRTMENQVSYSTVYLVVEEVKQYTPVAEQTVGERIVTGFTRSLANVGKGVLNFGIGMIVSLPYLVLWAAVILIVVFVIRAVIRRKNRKAVKEEEKPQNE